VAQNRKRLAKISLKIDTPISRPPEICAQRRLSICVIGAICVDRVPLQLRVSEWPQKQETPAALFLFHFETPSAHIASAGHLSRMYCSG
jgi:hypothetical protein